jgi:hypothetical protein
MSFQPIEKCDICNNLCEVYKTYRVSDGKLLSVRCTYHLNAEPLKVNSDNITLCHASPVTTGYITHS